ncbi:DNA gyrase subunit B [Paenibacillus phyllosphaerae]|uniref:DNA topoisomerase (ATP-hydrolyzing) n=1 Tax=Paenibacillus phyllosphaerae TaxID=274593 RepID=A0A7W5FQ48_9BACL|nr:ATP-binding protein [Paenibacillus phyllosphaerae]MBB3112664.1 DNA gyrase subunit B [Paenibacillus phyllosphaerae]
MSTTRDYGTEIDALAQELRELKQLLQPLLTSRPAESPGFLSSDSPLPDSSTPEFDLLGTLFYAGQLRGHGGFRLPPQQRQVSELLTVDSDRGAKVLAALGSKQRLDILTAVLRGPLTGAELVDQLHMGTTGQLYHHTKALLGADLLVQEERGGRYSVPAHRVLPLLLLLSSISDLLDTSLYMELADVRNHAGAYLGEELAEYDPHHLLWAVLENSLLEHEAGYCTRIGLIMQTDGSLTVTDNGRGIPISALPDSRTLPLQAVLTEIGKRNTSASVLVPGGLKGIQMPMVNALSSHLSVEVRREGRVWRQEFKHGIPQSEPQRVGLTQETGTSMTFKPDSEIFNASFSKEGILSRIAEIQANYPKLDIAVY